MNQTMFKFLFHLRMNLMFFVLSAVLYIATFGPGWIPVGILMAFSITLTGIGILETISGIINHHKIYGDEERD